MSPSRDVDKLPDPKVTDRRMRRELKWAMAILALLFVLFLVERIALPIPKVYSFWSNILFFGLINLNVIFICVLLFLILRNLAKLLFERRQKILGSQLRARLVVAFTGFALIPTIIMFYAAWTFVTRSIDNWFSLQIETSLSESVEVAQNYYGTYKKNSQFFAQSLAKQLAQGEHLEAPSPAAPPAPEAPEAAAPEAAAADGDKPPAKSTSLVNSGEERIQRLFDTGHVAAHINAKQREYNLGMVEIYTPSKKTPVFVSAKRKRIRDEEGRSINDFLAKGFQGRTTTEIYPFRDGEVVRGVAPVTVDDQVVAAVVVSYFVPKSVLQRMQAIRKTYEDYRQLLLLKDPIMSSYIVIFALISMFIFFAATWFGFFLARGIAVPIRRMAEATELVAAGDLDARIEISATDEMGRLINSFNRMIEDLKTSREEATRANNDLRETNLVLEQRRQYMETVLANITTGVVGFALDGKVSTINKQAIQILGLDESVVGRHYHDAFGGAFTRSQIDEIMHSFNQDARQTVEREVEASIKGESRMILMRLTILPTSVGGEDIVAVMVLDDLTELIKAKRVAAWREIARRIAHEIKNPLTPIQLAAQRLRRRYGNRFTDEADQVFFESTATIIRQVSEMKRLVQEFSDFARLAEVQLRPNQLNEIINETIVLYSEAHADVRFTFVADDHLPMLNLDRSQIKRVFINLLDNAVDAVTGQGEVLIRTGVDQQNECVYVHVIDDGVGLPDAYRARLYEPYFSTKKMGTGLGLAIVHQILQDHGANIDMRDNEPKGTCVVVTFPLTLAVAPRDATDIINFG